VGGLRVTAGAGLEIVSRIELRAWSTISSVRLKRVTVKVSKRKPEKLFPPQK
jgi:hypothetical protein